MKARAFGLWLLGLALLGPGSLQAADKAYTIAIIPKGTTHEFWKSVHAGALKAAGECEREGVKVNIVWKGPFKEDDRDQQMQVVENFMIRRVNGMVLAPLDSQALAKPVENAVKARIPVVIIDSALKSDQYLSFVATDNYRGGAMAAERLGELLGGKGNVILLRYAVGSASTEEREAGFLDTVKAKFPNLKLISSDQYGGATRETAYQASQNVLNRFGREVQGIFVPNETTTLGMAKAVRDFGLGGGKVKVVGFDANAASIGYVKAGDMQGLMVQNPFQMGYLGLRTVVANLQGKTVEKRIDTGVTLITPENLDDPKMKELLYPPLEQYLKN